MPKIVKYPPAPGSPEWRRTITASKVGAILGVSRWQSQFSVWHEMAGLVEPEVLDADRMKWGHVAERSLSDWWRYKNPGWKLNPRRGGTHEIVYTNPELPFPNMATLDRRAYRPDRPQGERFCILECKTAGTLKDWGRPGTENSVPRDYAAQVLFQMGVSGIHRASVVALGPSPEPEIHEIEFDPDAFADMVARLSDWQATLDMGIPPELDSEKSTYATVRGLHPDIDLDGVVQIDHAVALDLLQRAVAEDEGKAAARRARSDAQVLMGNAKYLRAGEVKVADRRVKEGGTPYVQFNKSALKEFL